MLKVTPTLWINEATITSLVDDPDTGTLVLAQGPHTMSLRGEARARLMRWLQETSTVLRLPGETVPTLTDRLEARTLQDSLTPGEEDTSPF
jgi:hypothetical protein